MTNNMNTIILAFTMLAGVGALPDYKQLQNKDVGTDIDMLHPERNHKVFTNITAESYGIAGNINKEIQEALENLNDPYEFYDKTEVFGINHLASIIVSLVDIHLAGHSHLIIDTLRARLLIPLYPRITFKFILPKIVLNIGYLSATIINDDAKLHSSISGQLSIINSSIEGRMTIGAITKRITNLTIDLKIGTIKSTLVGHLGRLDISGVLTDIITDIVPQILRNSSNQINKALEDTILKFYKES